MSRRDSSMSKEPRLLAPPFPDPSTLSPEIPTVEQQMKLISIPQPHYRHSSHTPPPVMFRPPSSIQPADRPIVVKSLSAQLAALDEVYNEGEHRRLDDIAKEQNLDSSRLERSTELLIQYQQSRLGYIHCLGDRLQGVMGVRNARVFDICDSEREAEYPQNNLRSAAVRKGLEYSRALSILRNPLPRYNLRSSGRRQENLSKRGAPDATQDNSIHYQPPRNHIEALVRYNYRNKLAPQSRILRPSLIRVPNPVPVVDVHSGKGLRELLHSRVHVRKRDCKSITFCDFTPNVLTAAFNNKLLGHWTSKPHHGKRIEAYELDLPATFVHPQTGQASQTVDRWLFVFISHPIITLKPPFGLPPSFTLPIPSSWILFACPLGNTTQYPEDVEAQEILARQMCKIIQKRQDFDFSHYGIPIFEFASENSLAALGEQCSPFMEEENFTGVKCLSAGDVAGFYSVEHDRVGHAYEVEWWRSFYDGIKRDSLVWEEIRTSMSRGKCRVVLRWNDVEPLPYEEGVGLHHEERARGLPRDYTH